MKVLLGAAAAAALLVSPAFAQTTPQLPANCAGFEPAPTLPDGATANHAAMTAAAERVDAWRLAREAKQQACQTEINTLRAQLDAMIQAYNTAGQERVDVVNAWNVEVQEFSARGGSSNRRRGSVITRPDDER